MKILKVSKLLLIFLLISFLTLTFSCTKVSKDYLEDSFAIVYQNNKPMLIDKNLKTYDLSYYNEVIDIFNDYIAVKKDGKYGFINLTGRLVVPTKYDAVYPMYENKAVVKLDGKYLIINEKNETLYTFTDNIYSESYFSCNKLVITNGEKYGYLTFKDNEFILGDLSYDSAKPYLNDYAVIGNKEKEIVYKVDDEGGVTEEIDSIILKENLKYTHININGDYLYHDKLFDFADDFYEGYARVANYEEISYATVGRQPSYKKYMNGLMYSYINPNGEYLHMDYTYRRNLIITTGYGSGTVIDETVHDDYLIKFPYATNFNDGYCITAKFEYLPSNNQFIKEYMFISTTGDMPFAEAIYYYPTSYRYGYDLDNTKGYRTQMSGQFWPSQLNKIGDTYCFSSGNTLNNSYYKIKYSYRDLDKDYILFGDVKWNHPYLDVTNPAEWATQFNEKYLKGVKNFILLQNKLEVPYEMTKVSYSKYFSTTSPLVVARISYSDTYGLIMLTTSTAHNNEHDVDYTVVNAEYFLPPIYQKIVY